MWIHITYVYRIRTRPFVEELVTSRKIKIYLLAVFKSISRLDDLQHVNHLLIVHLLYFHGSRQEQKIHWPDNRKFLIFNLKN